MKHLLLRLMVCPIASPKSVLLFFPLYKSAVKALKLAVFSLNYIFKSGKECQATE